MRTFSIAVFIILMLCNYGAPLGATQVAAGSHHTVVLKNDGTVWAWGDNNYGQIGNGIDTEENEPLPVQAAGLSGVICVAAGGYHTVAVKTDSTVWVCGDNSHGQLGDGTTTGKRSPGQVLGLSGVAQIAAGGYHTIAVKTDGNVWAWGDNDYGQLGDGTLGTDRLSPVRVPNLSGVTQVAAGVRHTIALRSDGTVWAWGDNTYGELGDGTSGTSRTSPVRVSSLSGVTQVAAGYYHTLALKSDGTVWAWGVNYSGQLGDGTITNRLSPMQVAGLSGVVQIAAGGSHTVAVKSDGTVWVWGDNTYGQLGDAAYGEHRYSPVQVTGLSGITCVAAGSGHTVALKTDGSVWVWGYNKHGQLGDGTVFYKPAPGRVQGLLGVAQVVAGSGHTVALKSDSTVWAWGSNAFGELGNDFLELERLCPRQVPGLSGVTQMAAGSHHVVALRNNGTVWTWGDNHYGQLGVEDADGFSPVQVQGLSGITQVAAGYYHTVVLRNDGTVWTWGLNNRGQLGDGSTYEVYSPVQVQGLSGVTQVAAGYYHTLAIRSDGTVWSWGYNNYGQLGDGTSGSDRLSPVQVPSLSGVTQVAAGQWHTVVRKNDGTVWAWGSNGSGQLGDGTRVQRLSPVRVSSLAGVAQVAAGQIHTVALKNDGTIWAWGWNSLGQIGDGTTTDRSSPVKVPGMSSVARVAAGQLHSIAVKSDGTVWSWGCNYDSQLGYVYAVKALQDTVTDTTLPVGSVIVNDWATYTTSRTVTLTLSATDDSGTVSSMHFSNDGVIWSDWQTYSTSASWTLSAGDGTKTVYARFRDPSGNESEVATDGIILDITPPTGRVTINGGDAFTSSSNVTLALSAADSLSTVGYMRFSNDGTTWSGWQSYLTSKTWTLSSGEGIRTVLVQFRDRAGNVSSNASATIGLGTPRSIALTRASANGSVAIISSKTVTATFSDCIYLEETDRNAGIRVAPAPVGVVVGNLLDVSGTVQTVNSEKTIQTVAWKVQLGIATVSPLLLRTSSIIGANWQYNSYTGAGQKGVAGESGLNNIGLLVRICGRIVQTGMAGTDKWWMVDDGSGGRVKITIPYSFAGTAVNSLVAVTGISTCEASGSDLLRVIRPRSDSDIQVLLLL